MVWRYSSNPAARTKEKAGLLAGTCFRIKLLDSQMSGKSAPGADFQLMVKPTTSVAIYGG